MIPLLGSPKRLCTGVTRRDLLQIGGLGLFGVGLGDVLALQKAQAGAAAAHRFGQAKRCILVYLFGSPPQHETFDPKPEAPAEIQGEMKSISTALPGVRIGEGLPRLARILDRLTVIRSLHHGLPFHGVHYAVSGIPSISTTVEADPSDRSLWPFLGSVVDYCAERAGGAEAPAVPRNIALPFRLYARANFRLLGGPYAGFLGSRYDPVWTDFPATGTRAVTDYTGKNILDPYAGIEPGDRFTIAGTEVAPHPQLTPARVDLRRSLLEQFDRARFALDGSDRVRSFDHCRQQAYSLLTSPRLARALDLEREPRAVRERFGMTLFGQSLLAARRLVEAGSRFVTAIWDTVGHFANGWDTHYYHYHRLRKFLLPGFDESFTALILDLEERGLLDDTLVLCLSEHGRTPRLSNSKGGGREHWSGVYSAVCAGGGMARGKVVGSSDAHGGTVRDVPLSPKDILATAFHLLGIDPHTMVPDRLGRPVPVAGAGVLRTELLG